MLTVKDQNGKRPVLSDRAVRVAGALAKSRTGLTRAELIEAAAVSPPTLTRALADLRGAAWLETDDSSEGRGGQGPGGAVRLGRNAGLVLGVDIGRAHRRASLADAHGQLIGKLQDEDTSSETDKIDHFGAGLLSTIAELVFRTVTESDGVGSNSYTIGEVRAIGVGIPFPVGPHGMTVGMFAPELSGLDLAGILLELLRRKASEYGTSLHPDLKIRFAKDGDLGAHALWRDHLERHRGGHGSAHERDQYSLLYVKASYGIDAGIICHGLLVTGERGLAGQIGHMLVPEPERRGHESAAYDVARSVSHASNEPCPRCNRWRCLENVASGRAIMHQLVNDGDAGPNPRNVEQLVEYVNTQQTARPETRKALIRAGTAVGLVLADAARLADPAKIVIGGLLAGAGDTFMTPLRIAFAEAGLAGLDPTIESVQPKDIKSIELEGAVALALKHAKFEWRPEAAL
jgi:predicted NBD/HSP70 family sugar kinase